MLRPFGILFQLLTQLANEDAQRLHVANRLAVPHFPEEVAVRQHFAGMDHELLQDLVFLGRQLDFVDADHHPPVDEIDCKIARLEDRPAALSL